LQQTEAYKLIEVGRVTINQKIPELELETIGIDTHEGLNKQMLLLKTGKSSKRINSLLLLFVS
jgi:hypothetical protein